MVVVLVLHEKLVATASIIGFEANVLNDRVKEGLKRVLVVLEFWGAFHRILTKGGTKADPRFDLGIAGRS